MSNATNGKTNGNEMEILKAQLAAALLENNKLKSVKAGGLSLRVSEKGGVSVYGLGRFPVTFYKEQWSRLLGMAEDIKTFINDNESKLAVKAPKATMIATEGGPNSGAHVTQ